MRGAPIWEVSDESRVQRVLIRQRCSIDGSYGHVIAVKGACSVQRGLRFLHCTSTVLSSIIDAATVGFSGFLSPASGKHPGIFFLGKNVFCGPENCNRTAWSG